MDLINVPEHFTNRRLHILLKHILQDRSHIKSPKGLYKLKINTILSIPQYNKTRNQKKNWKIDK